MENFAMMMNSGSGKRRKKLFSAFVKSQKLKQQ
jgi:hypothetical protein